MKFIKVKTNSYKNISLVPRELRFFTEYGNAVFVLRKLPEEKLPRALIEKVSKSGIVTRSDGVEYVVCSRSLFKEYVNAKVPVTCVVILIRKTYIAKKTKHRFSDKLPWLRT